jgi:hypothetical protein
MKLYDCGSTLNFSERKYKQALSATLKGKAYVAFCKLREKGSSISYAESIATKEIVPTQTPDPNT